MKKHLERSSGRALCGKPIGWGALVADTWSEADCLICREKWRLEKDHFFPGWRIGGEFDKDGQLRENMGNAKRTL